jgi:hypothetical protein
LLISSVTAAQAASTVSSFLIARCSCLSIAALHASVVMYGDSGRGAAYWSSFWATV